MSQDKRQKTAVHIDDLSRNAETEKMSWSRVVRWSILPNAHDKAPECPVWSFLQSHPSFIVLRRPDMTITMCPSLQHIHIRLFTTPRRVKGKRFDDWEEFDYLSLIFCARLLYPLFSVRCLLFSSFIKWQEWIFFKALSQCPFFFFFFFFFTAFSFGLSVGLSFTEVS